VVHLPFLRRPLALPLLFRLNRTRKQDEAQGVVHIKKTEHLADCLAVLAARFPHRTFQLLADDAYSCKTVLQALPDNIGMIGRLPMDAALRGPVPTRGPGTQGRSRKWGFPTPNPLTIAEDASVPWVVQPVFLYRKGVVSRAKTWRAWWASCYRAGRLWRLRSRLLRRPEPLVAVPPARPGRAAGRSVPAR